MMTENHKMIVFHTTKYKESSLIVHGYTDENGRSGFLLRGGKNNKNKRALHPLSIIDYISVKSLKGNLDYIKEYVPVYKLNTIRTDFNKSSIAMFISEVLYRNLLMSEKDEGMFDFLEKSILLLENRTDRFANFHLWFLLKYCSIMGFPPEQGFQTEYNPFSEEQQTVAHILTEYDFENAMNVPMNGTSRTELLKSLIKYIEFHTGTRLELKSLSIFQEINKTII